MQRKSIWKKYISGLFVTLACLGFVGVPAWAADYSDGDIHKNDYRWLQFNLMQSLDNKLPFNVEKETYFEMEFGGRNGIIQLYGYLDVFDILNRKKDDRHNADNFFFKFAPRFSLDGITRKDLSFGPVQEVYVSTLTHVGDKVLFEHFIGLGVDIDMPWFGTWGSNLMARYVKENFGAADEKKWSGYIWTNNWFKPFYFFDNKSFISYQGYLDIKFKYDKLANAKPAKPTDPTRTKDSVEWFNGFYWHNDQWAAGYGLKYYKDMANFKDGSGKPKQTTTGFGHYFDVTYKF